MTKCCALCGQARPDVEVGIRVDPESGHAIVNGREFRFAPFEASILSLLITNSHRVVRRSEVHAHLYGDRPDGGPDPRIIDVHLCHVRKRLAGTGYEIETFRAYGWKLRAVQAQSVAS